MHRIERCDLRKIAKDATLHREWFAHKICDGYFKARTHVERNLYGKFVALSDQSCGQFRNGIATST